MISKATDNNKEFIPGYLQQFLLELFTANVCQASIGRYMVKAILPQSLCHYYYSGLELKWIMSSN